MTRAPYVTDAAIVGGFAAHVVDRLLARYLEALLPAMSPEQRAEAAACQVAVRRAAMAYRARPVADVPDMPEPDMRAGSPAEIDTGTAAALLRVTPRQARRLAEGGLGRKVAGRWWLEREAVMEYGRRSA